ncbi:hypothetical protein CGRA01v4_09178 [Colletotrichum graminicola]|nr:hypothetical protein CGRA01v4_09178 [Colletotrichum graminicola]
MGVMPVASHDTTGGSDIQEITVTQPAPSSGSQRLEDNQARVWPCWWFLGGVEELCGCACSYQALKRHVSRQPGRWSQAGPKAD